ncbi:hypothetical protein [Geosporobacter ferrireducens]|uniref:hypothetical protein n=1 Tax=Geosporobacter ferrireducens TaxID=1424294 RepID=UPI00139ABF62|nr:hypothetical protein [Geosporobacter ferrireducens]MTI53787.1 hypothetical protein [Geosporobacter ferrireducens]
MTTLEQLKWLPVWLILSLLLFTTGTYFFKQSLLTHLGDEYLRAAANKGKFEAVDVERLLNRIEKYGFDRDKIEIEITPAAAYGAGVSKDTDILIGLNIDTNTKAMISAVFEWLDPTSKKFYYRYSRVAKSEEFFDEVTP